MGTANVRFLLGLLLGALLGGGLIHLLGGLDSIPIGEVQALSPTQELSSPQSTLSSHSDEADEGSERVLARALPAAAKVKKVDDAELKELMASVGESGASRASGSGSINGVVMTKGGEGLGGVVLRLNAVNAQSPAPSSTSVGTGAPEFGTLEDAVRKTAEQFYQSRARRLETVSASFLKKNAIS